MSEEKHYIKEKKDALDDLIADRLGERQKKLERMRQMGKGGTSVTLLRNTPVWIATAVAASLIGLLIMILPPTHVTSPIDELGIECPSLQEYRSGSPCFTEIQDLLEKEDWSAAQYKVYKALCKSEKDMDSLLAINERDVAQQYELDVEKEEISQLRWIYIYVLLKESKIDEAVVHIEKYISQEGEHKHDAEILLKKILK